MSRHITAAMVGLVTLCLATAPGLAEKGQIIGTVVCARSAIAVSVHPVVLVQGRDTIARTITDRLGKFKLEFSYAAGQPIVIKTGSTTGYLEAQGAVEPDTEVAIKVMPRWATVIGIVTSRDTGRGVEGVVVRVGRGESLLPDNWATSTTDAIGVFMLKVPAFDGDDVSKPVRDLWLSVNEGETGNMQYAQVRTDTLPLWAWPDPTQPTKVEVSLPAANATGLTVADVVSISTPEAMLEREGAAGAPSQAPPAGGTAAAATQPTATAAGTSPAAGPALPLVTPGEFIWTCPKTGQRYRITIAPVD